MQVTPHTDVDVVAIEQDDAVSVMLELFAPTSQSDATRPPAAVEIVLDRSGSMNGDRLETAKHALISLIDRLRPDDRLGVIAFDDDIAVVVPAGELADKNAARHAVAQVGPGGMTNLSGGLLRG